MKTRWLKDGEEDWSKWLGEMPNNSKRLIIEKCMKNNVSIYVDDATEQAGSIFRAVASEAELEKRLDAKLNAKRSTISLGISAMSLLIAIAALIKSFVR